MKDGIEHLQCPDCLHPLQKSVSEWLCASCEASYPESHRGVPILFSRSNVLFEAKDYLNASAADARAGSSRRLLASSVNLSRKRELARMRSCLDRGPRVLLVGAGNQRAEIETALGTNVTALDVDARADVDVFADAHQLPFPSEHFDAVVTTAVLEHVVSPERVVQEISRVLKVGGLVYSEYPFLQQVHEGAYDFTRVTLGGHRLLYRDYEEISAGAVAGPGTALVWSMEHFMLALTNANTDRRRKAVKGAIRATCGWIARLDRRIAERPAGRDGASCTYFLGRRRDSPSPLHDREIVDRYDGAQTLRHS